MVDALDHNRRIRGRVPEDEIAARVRDFEAAAGVQLPAELAQKCVAVVATRGPAQITIRRLAIAPDVHAPSKTVTIDGSDVPEVGAAVKKALAFR